ncbi:unnamed protein product [Heligmosomoides polygyrus]|uniref:Uncharacterized protein n=1 Tax=Heligmosomoides polygyrus TaxID=6339 RepID=A0A3P8BAH5_HELPZ|nr:unnamed protein product [Heligmosomoides polygyrus]
MQSLFQVVTAFFLAAVSAAVLSIFVIAWRLTGRRPLFYDLFLVEIHSWGARRFVQVLQLGQEFRPPGSWSDVMARMRSRAQIVFDTNVVIQSPATVMDDSAARFACIPVIRFPPIFQEAMYSTPVPFLLLSILLENSYTFLKMLEGKNCYGDIFIYYFAQIHSKTHIKQLEVFLSTLAFMEQSQKADMLLTHCTSYTCGLSTTSNRTVNCCKIKQIFPRCDNHTWVIISVTCLMPCVSQKI